MRIKNTIFNVLILIFVLEIAGCSLQHYSSSHSNDSLQKLGEIFPNTPPPEFPPVDQYPIQEAPQLGRLSCEEPFPVQDYLKPPLNIDDLPQSVNPLLVNRKRVIGFTFTDGQAALLASPARAKCKFDQANLTAVGVVWSWSEVKKTNEPVAHVVAVDTRINENFAHGFLIPIDASAVTQEQSGNLFQKIKPVWFAVNRLQAQGGADFSQMPPADVSIRANSVCFRYGKIQFCSQNEPLLSPKSLFPKAYNEQVVQPIRKAANLLLQRPTKQNKTTVRSATRASRILNSEETGSVLAEMAISEIEQSERIKECHPTEPDTCKADIVVAAIEHSDNMLDRILNVGIVVVNNELHNFSDGKKNLPRGWYVIKAKMKPRNQLFNQSNQSQRQDDFKKSMHIKVNADGIAVESGRSIVQEIPARLRRFVTMSHYKNEIDKQSIIEIFGTCWCCFCSWSEWD